MKKPIYMTDPDDRTEMLKLRLFELEQAHKREDMMYGDESRRINEIAAVQDNLAELIYLREKTKHLPVTLDDEMVVPGTSDRVWCWIEDGRLVEPGTGTLEQSYNWRGWVALFHKIDGVPFIGVSPGKCWFTRDAANAAAVCIMRKND